MSIFYLVYLINSYTLNYIIGCILYITSVSFITFRIYKALQRCSFVQRTKFSSFIAYFSTFTVIFGQTMLILYSTSIDNSSFELGILVWIIYISALLILFLIFTALTSAESIHNTNKSFWDEFSNSLIANKSPFTKFLIVFLSTALFLMVLFDIIATTYVSNVFMWSLQAESSVVKKSLLSLDSSGVFFKLCDEIVRNPERYLLSAILQGLTLVLVLLLLIY